MPASINDVTVIIPQHGQSELTVHCVSGLIRHGVKAEQILVIDNNSSAEELISIRRLTSGIVNIMSNTGKGLTQTWNQAWREAKTPIIVFLNNDVVVRGEFISSLVCGFENKKVMVTGIARKGDHVVEKMISKRNFSGPLNYKLIQGWCFAVRREFLFSKEGFDERFLIYFSDTDLFLQAQLEDAESLFTVADLPLIHLEHQTLSRIQSRKKWWLTDKKQFMEKWTRKKNHENSSDM